MNLPFAKYQGTGNDFILIDNRSKLFDLTQDQIERLCHRRFGIGADGLMLLENETGYDFKMVYYNSDGKEGSMCGNGGRCITRFAYDLGIHKEMYHFIAIDGPHAASIETNGTVRLKMKDVPAIEMHTTFDFVDTGSPHVVKLVPEISEYDVVGEGRSIRNSPKYKEKGVNVNFVKRVNESGIFVRTYERGVEDETYSCGTGVTASALVHAHNDLGFNHVSVETNGGHLYVEFDRTGETSFENIWLAGPAVKVFEGVALL
ncbi:MAG TPA: diaminopimelate epimerase [Phnomibacter sp.]|nr:diaminopimelate epimerase [Phnomibacter sp.]